MSEVPDGFPRPRGARPKTSDPSVRARRNTRYGHEKQGYVRRYFEHLTGLRARFHGAKANEETWTHLPLRIEVKAGMQVGPVATAYLAQEKQSDQSKPIGDIRPFVGVSCPEGMSDFLVTVRASRLVDVMHSLGFYQANEGESG